MHLARQFELARREALKSDHKLFRMGAVILRRGKLVARGRNKLTTHPASPNAWKTIHAEHHALLNLDGAADTIFIVRITRRAAKLASTSAPCPDCFKLLHTHGISTIWYLLNNEPRSIRI